MFKAPFSPARIFAGAGVLSLILVVSIYLSFQRFKDLRNANAWNVHTYQVLLETSHLISGLVNMQTGTRGFLQTGDEKFLDPYKNGRREYEEHYATSLALTGDNPQQQHDLKKLRTQYLKWRVHLIEPLLKMRRATPSTAMALQLAKPGTEQRKVTFDAMRDTVSAIENREQGLLVERTQKENVQQNVAQTALLVNGALAVLLAVGLSTLLVAWARKMELINRRLSEQNERLKRIERESEVLNNHNEMILQAVRDGIAGVNQSGRTTFFNPAAEAITGYSAAEVIGKPQHNLLHFKHLDGSPYPVTECPIMATIKDGKVHQATNEVFWRKDGQPVAIEFTSTPLVMRSEDEDNETDDPEGGKRVGAVVVFRDISERQKTEATLRELASMVQYSDDAIIGLTLDGVITRWNRAARGLYGYSDWEVVGQYLDKLVLPDQSSELPELLAKIKANQPVDRYETTRRRKDGTTVQVIASLSPIVDETGQVIGASSISRETFRSRTHREREATTQNAPGADMPGTHNDGVHATT